MADGEVLRFLAEFFNQLEELSHLCLNARREPPLFQRLFRSLIEGDPLLPRKGVYLLDRLFSDPSGRDIDDPIQADTVRGVGNQLQVGEDILDLL